MINQQNESVPIPECHNKNCTITEYQAVIEGGIEWSGTTTQGVPSNGKFHSTSKKDHLWFWLFSSYVIDDFPDVDSCCEECKCFTGDNVPGKWRNIDVNARKTKFDIDTKFYPGWSKFSITATYHIEERQTTGICKGLHVPKDPEQSYKSLQHPDLRIEDVKNILESFKVNEKVGKINSRV